MLHREPVYINNFNLSTSPGVAVYNYEFNNMPMRNINRSKLARADQSLLTSAEYVEKQITIQVFVSGETKNQIEERYETLKGLLQIPESTIRVEQGGIQVTYRGTLSGISQQYHGQTLKLDITFLCSDPVGRSALTSTLLTANLTASTHTYSITVEGSAKARPVIRIIINSLTGGTDKTIQLLNAETGQGITVQRTWSGGEVLTVDSYNKTVEVDDAAVDYGGTFPIFFPGSRSFQYIDDLTTRDVDIEITYNKQFA